MPRTACMHWDHAFFKCMETLCLSPCVAFPLQTSLPCVGFPYDTFNIEDTMLPADDDMGIPSEDDEEVEQDVQTETGFGCVIGEEVVRLAMAVQVAGRGAGQQAVTVWSSKAVQTVFGLECSMGIGTQGPNSTTGCKAAWAIMPEGDLA